MDKQTEKTITELSPWFHNIHLPDGAQTAPDHFLGDFPAFKWEEIAPELPWDLSGKKVLDVGCNAGFYSIQLARRGAEVTAIDLDPHYLRQAAWIAAQFGLEERIQFSLQQVYDLAHEEEKYDLVWFMGVFYHLRYPLLAMDILAQKCQDWFVFQSLSMPGKEVVKPDDDYQINQRDEMLKAGWPKMAFIENQLNGDPTNWWAPNKAAVLAMMRSCGLDIISEPADETYIGRKTKAGASESWNRSEYLSAIGKDWKANLEEKVKGK
ncbi:MAG: TIGR04290 family methyltransferase [bacterium]